MQDIEKLEATLWEAADNLRANSHKSSSEYCMPVLGVIFLRHATNRYDAACGEIAREQATGKMPKRPLDRKGTNAGRGACPTDLESRQLSPVPMSTTTGTVNWQTPPSLASPCARRRRVRRAGLRTPIRRGLGAAWRTGARPPAAPRR